jgi:hypothetical protein
MPTEITNEYWEISKKVFEDNSTKSYEYREILSPDDTSIRAGTLKTNLKFYQNDLDSFFLPSKSYMLIHARPIKADGTDFADTDLVAFQFGGSIFSQARYMVADKEIERIDGCARTYHLNNLLDYSKNYEESVATEELFFVDKGNGGTAVAGFTVATTSSQVLTVGAPAAHAVAGTAPGVVTYASAVSGEGSNGIFSTNNSGFFARQKFTNASQMVAIKIPLSRIFGFCKHSSMVHRGARHRIQFDINNDAEIFQLDDGIKAGGVKLDIAKMTLWMPFLEPNLPVLSKLETTLAMGGISEIGFEYSTMYGPFDMGKNPVIRKTITSLSEQPTKVIVAFKQTEFYNKPEFNSYKYDHMELTSLNLKIGNRFIPSQKFEGQWTGAVTEATDLTTFLREFNRVSNKDSRVDGGNLVNMVNFPTLFPFYCIDLRSSLYEIVFGAGNSIDLEIQANVTAPGGDATKTFQMFIWVYSNRLLNLDVAQKQMILSLK